MSEILVSELKSDARELCAGDEILLTGTVYTARDAAHKRIFAAIRDNRPLPFDIAGSVIYYAGPTPAKNGLPIGSCGPTTSSRMDVYAPSLYDLGMAASVGKGARDRAVVDAVIRNGALYLCAVGGAGAIVAGAVRSLEVIAYPELGCESVKKLTVYKFPLFVGIDTKGNSLFTV